MPPTSNHVRVCGHRVAFAIWGVIFSLQGIVVVMLLLPQRFTHVPSMQAIAQAVGETMPLPGSALRCVRACYPHASACGLGLEVHLL